MSDHENLTAALAAFQSEMPTVAKAKTANVGSYSYTYADLAAVTEQAMPLLSKHGLAFMSRPKMTEHGLLLVGTLLHVNGQREEGELPLNGRNPQEIGSSITYARRYLFGCMTGIVTDDDDDGAAATRHAKRQTPEGNSAAAAEQLPETPPRETILAKLDDACDALGKTRAALTKKWRDTHGIGAVSELDDATKVPDSTLFQYVLSLQPYVEQARRQQQATEPDSEPVETPAAVICDATRLHPVVDKANNGVTQKCTREAGHEGDHAWW